MTAVVVGGGISGILSALLLRQRHESVLLVEKSPELGGLLRSERHQLGVPFDLGTHIISSTANQALDAIVLGFPEIQTEWNRYDRLKAGNYLFGRLNADSPCLDANTLPPHVFSQGLVELLSITQPPPADDLKAYLEGMYGPTLSRHLFAPIIQKILDRSLSELDPRAHELFMSKRIMLLTPQASRELKTSTIFDEKIAFHSYHEGASGFNYYYPRSGGIGRWIELLTGSLREHSIEVVTGTTVSAVEMGERDIRALTLSNGRTLNCSELVWTLPPALLMTLCGFAPLPSLPPGDLRRTQIFHFIFDRPFESDLFYVTCYEPSLLTYRVTLYPNIRDGQTARAPFNCTVEVISSPAADVADLPIRLVEELKQMGLVSKQAELLFSQSSGLWHGFPVLSKRLVEQMRYQRGVLEAALDNVLFLGRSKGEGFFMKDVLLETFETLAPQQLKSVVARSNSMSTAPGTTKVN